VAALDFAASWGELAATSVAGFAEAQR